MPAAFLHKMSLNTRLVWALLLVMTVADAAGMAVMGVEPYAPRFLVLLAAVTGMLGLSAFYTFLRRDARIAALAHTGAVTLVFTTAAAVMSYLAVMWRHPLIDDALSRFDLSLGLDWKAAYDFVRGHFALHLALALAYFSLIVQMLLLLCLLNFLKMQQRCWELMWLFMATSIGCLVVSAFLPAAGAFAFYQTEANDPYVLAFNDLRDGTLKIWGQVEMQGVIQFPSLHAALGVVFAYAARGVRVLFAVFLVLNILLILGTPSAGGHHFADVLAGLALAAVAIAAVRAVFKRATPESFAVKP